MIEMLHKKCDFTCMWNGVEDLYEWKTGNRAPEYLFFALSGFCSFVYLKQKNAECKKMIYWSNGLTKKMYDFMKDIVGFDYKVVEGKEFEYALKIAKKSIDSGNPVVMGALDMYELPYYEKYFKKIHIPIHHILMIGYDDKERKIFLNDCGKNEVQELGYDCLEKAWNVDLPGFSKKNTLFILKFNENIKSVEEIFVSGLLKKCEENLNPPVSIFGIIAMRKFGKEILKWKDELNDEDYRKALLHLVEYTGFPPSLPVGLIENNNIDKEEIPENHKAARDKFSEVLKYLANTFNIPKLEESAEMFQKSGIMIENLTKEITEYLKGDKMNINTAPKIIEEIANIEEKAYINIKNILKDRSK